MIDIVDAIRALDPNAWVGCSNNDINKIHWHDGNPKKLTKEQIQAKYDELVESNKKLQYQRDRKEAYPEIGDQLDDLYKKGAFSDEMAAKIKKVKDDNPKPS